MFTVGEGRVVVNDAGVVRRIDVQRRRVRDDRTSPGIRSAPFQHMNCCPLHNGGNSLKRTCRWGIERLPATTRGLTPTFRLFAVTGEITTGWAFPFNFVIFGIPDGRLKQATRHHQAFSLMWPHN